jgi:alkylhydroperoxidase family enzyme
MLLAVAGLAEGSIEQRNRRLASGDWSSFRPAERAAFHFARKQANGPASITAGDFRRLVRHFGPERAIDLVWWCSRCHFMTRVSHAFGLPLEKENVFDGFRPLPKPGNLAEGTTVGLAP